MDFPALQYIQLYPTVRCNQQCSFCFNTDSPYTSDLSFESALKLLDILSANNVMELDIMGGEPFLLPWMPDFIRTSTDKGISANISTNGSCPSTIAGLGGADASKLNIGVSLEGSTKEKHNRLTGSGNFDLALESLKKISAAGLDPLAKTVLNMDTKDDIQNIIDLIRSLEIRRYFLIHMDLFSKDSECRRLSFSYPDFITLSESFRDTNPDMGIFSVTASCFNADAAAMNVRCAGGNRKISVLPDGSVFPCNLFHGFDEFRLGNIFSEKLSSIMGNPRLQYFRTFSGNRCTVSACSNRASCTGACPAHGYYHYRDLDGPDIRCMPDPGRL
jgi:radical SAM protein with 4Fe4S-binding SPASM domain